MNRNTQNVVVSKYVVMVMNIKNIRTRISTEARAQALRSSRIFIPKGPRCCLTHLTGKLFKSDALLVIPSNETLSQFKASQIEEMFDLLVKSSRVHNEFEAMGSDRLKVFTGRNRDKFLEKIPVHKFNCCKD